MHPDPEQQFPRKKEPWVCPPNLGGEEFETDRPYHDVRAIVGKGDWRARYIRGEDRGRKLQLWICPTLYQMEPTGRPDGVRPYGCTNYVEYLNGIMAEKQVRSADWIRETAGELQREIWLYDLRAMAFSTLFEFHKETPDLLAMVNACAWLVGIGMSEAAVGTLESLPDKIGRNCVKRLTSKIVRTGLVARVAAFTQSADMLQTVTELAEECEPLLETAVMAAQREREKLLEALMPSTVGIVRRSLGAEAAARFRKHLERGEYRDAVRCYVEGQEQKGNRVAPTKTAYPEPPVHERAVDLQWITHRWPFEGEAPQVRFISAAARHVIQERELLGVSQFELTGRPDGARPRGYDTLLDYHVLRIIGRGGRKPRKSDQKLSAKDAAALKEEASLFWRRASAWFSLRCWREAGEDYVVCLRGLDFLAQRGYTSEYAEWKVNLEAAIARATAWRLHEQKQGEQALRTLEAAMRKVEMLEQDLGDEGYYRGTIEPDYESILKQQPADSPARLRRELEKAVRSEQFEEAARLRDALAAAQRGPAGKRRKKRR